MSSEHHPPGPSVDGGPLGELTGRPYAVPLGPGPPPDRVLRDLGSLPHPGALWGGWFGGGVVLVHSPLRLGRPVDALAAAALLDDRPSLRPHDVGAGGRPELGGGWLTCLGYDPGSSWSAFYDSLLRWRDGGWTFETLGLDGRADVTSAALAGWRGRLAAAAPDAPRSASSPRRWAVGTFEAVGAAARPARLHHLRIVEEAIGRIHRGTFYQVNLATRLRADFTGDPVSLFADMAAELQPAWGALVSRGPERLPRTVASFSPELFLRVSGRRVTTSPIKGTAPRADDEQDAPALRRSAKDAAENVMIVDLMRNDLSRVSRPGTVQVEELLALEPHPGVWHLVSRVGGNLVDGVGLGQLLGATFPPGSVTGAPKGAAVRAAAELEGNARGVYTGSVGFASPLAGLELNVAIRTLEISGSSVELGVGGGITVDSVPVREWYECLDKAAPLLRAARSRLDRGLVPTPFPRPAGRREGVFETLLADGPRVLRLAAHLARLDLSCRELYGVGIPADLASRVRGAVVTPWMATPCRVAAWSAGPGRRAVRVLARPDAAGLELTISVSALGPRLLTSGLVLAERSPSQWRHKWSDRNELVAAESISADHPYFVSGAGDVSETSRGNVFCLGHDGVWRTPPLDEELLPGVTRRATLDLFAAASVNVRLEPFPAAALRRAAGAFWTSSLSGAVVVTTVDGVPIPRATRTADWVSRELGFTGVPAIS